MSEKVSKAQRIAAPFDYMMQNIHNNNEYPGKIIAEIITFTKIILMDFGVTPCTQIYEQLYNTKDYLLELLKYSKRKKLYFKDIKSFDEYDKDEAYFAFINMLIEDMLFQQLCKSWMTGADYNKHLCAEVKYILLEYIDDQQLKHLYSKEFKGEALAICYFDAYLVLTDKDASDKFCEFYYNRITRADYILYTEIVPSRLDAFYTWHNSSAYQNYEKEDMKKTYKKAKLELKQGERDYIEYTIRVRHRYNKGFSGIVLRRPICDFNNQRCLSDNRNKPFEVFARLHNKENKIRALKQLYVELVFSVKPASDERNSRNEICVIN